MREWSDWVSDVSSDLSKWRAEEASFTAVDKSLTDQREQISGVDLDEEATDLLRFQQIYQANSSVIQAAMRMFDTLITVTSR
jgi:flagellar hook-associated protein 1 FlgK